MRLVLLLAMVACACDDSRENAEALARRALGADARCMTDEQYKSDDVTYCTDGSTLIICTGDGCLTVNLRPEAAP